MYSTLIRAVLIGCNSDVIQPTGVFHRVLHQYPSLMFPQSPIICSILFAGSVLRVFQLPSRNASLKQNAFRSKALNKYFNFLHVSHIFIIKCTFCASLAHPCTTLKTTPCHWRSGVGGPKTPSHSRTSSPSAAPSQGRWASDSSLGSLTSSTSSRSTSSWLSSGGYILHVITFY